MTNPKHIIRNTNQTTTRMIPIGVAFKNTARAIAPLRGSAKKHVHAYQGLHPWLQYARLSGGMATGARENEHWSAAVFYASMKR